jgi:hypothetical protein
LANENAGKPEPGAQPVSNSKLNGAAEPRLTSGGRAGNKWLKNDFSGKAG